MFSTFTLGIVTADQMAQFDLLRTIWFENYSRSMGKIGSSAFEHVFLNEIKNHSTVSGLHNWVWYYLKEGQSGEQHSIDYKGYMNSVLLGNVSLISYIRNFLYAFVIVCHDAIDRQTHF